MLPIFVGSISKYCVIIWEIYEYAIVWIVLPVIFGVSWNVCHYLGNVQIRQYRELFLFFSFSFVLPPAMGSILESNIGSLCFHRC